MFSSAKMPSTTAVLSTYTTFAASAMLVRTMLNEVQTLTSQLIPKEIRDKILSKLGGRIRLLSSEMTLVIDEYNGYVLNQVYEAAEMYLRKKITSSVERLRVSMAPRENNLVVTIKEGEKTVDTFEGMRLVWQVIKTESQKMGFDDCGGMSTEKVERKSIELTFNRSHKEMVLNAYLPLVMECSKAIKKESKVVKLNQLGGYGEPVNLDHPSTFDTIAMDPAMKKELMDDLDRFVRRRDFYRRVGKAWKRGYLLYGPPGTGKSSLIAAMANYLKFDVYDLELTSMAHNNDLRRLLVSTANQSILVIEDIDCTIDLENREDGGNRHMASESQLTLSGLLNFMDGLWSSCGDERIIVVTTNHKDKLDPALLRPGRMDMHIHLSYCTPSGFRILASNYLRVNNHYMFGEIEKMMTEVEVTPAEVAEEMMRSDEADVALGGLLKLLQRKKKEKDESKTGGGGEEKEEVVNEEGKTTEEDMESGNENKGREKKKRKGRKGRGFTHQKRRR